MMPDGTEGRILTEDNLLVKAMRVRITELENDVEKLQGQIRALFRHAFAIGGCFVAFALIVLAYMLVNDGVI